MDPPVRTREDYFFFNYNMELLDKSVDVVCGWQSKLSQGKVKGNLLDYPTQPRSKSKVGHNNFMILSY
jgi:hypothetical protein